MLTQIKGMAVFFGIVKKLEPIKNNQPNLMETNPRITSQKLEVIKEQVGKEMRL